VRDVLQEWQQLNVFNQMAAIGPPDWPNKIHTFGLKRTVSIDCSN